MQTWLPAQETIESEISSMQGTWIEQMGKRVPGTVFMQTFLFFWQTFWRVISMMLLGMALYKWGIISAKKSKAFYLKMAVFGLGVGFFFTGSGIVQNFRYDWSMDFSMFAGSMYNYVGSLGSSLGYIALVMILAKSSNFNKLKYLIISVGKMAFTNYILMSILGAFIFYGHGLGLFCMVERTCIL